LEIESEKISGQEPKMPITKTKLRVLLITGCMSLYAMIWAAGQTSNAKAFLGARIIDGSGKAPMEKTNLLVRDGRIEAVGPSVKVPPGVEQIDVNGETIIPGLINTHGHVNDISQLGLYARYGVTPDFVIPSFTLN
jgi:hypothetical protein